MVSNIVVIGSSGAIGGAFVDQLSANYPEAVIHAFSRNHFVLDGANVRRPLINPHDEASLKSAAELVAEEGGIDLVIVASGMLHDDFLMPEKALQDISGEKFHRLFEVNTIFPALIAKYFLPKLHKDKRTVFAALSARVGSISDNQLGGWYAYRASKAALNMVIKNASIEIGRQNKEAIIIGLHPGTVDSDLSKPFQGNVEEGKLFTPEFSVSKMLEVLDQLKGEDTGKCFAWDGKEIEP